jgi:alkylation response protein AidB-like acyl-CoA dehydrogenase
VDRVSSLGDATAVAERLAATFAEQAGTRDAERALPHDQVRALKASGLLALSVPAEHGGIEAPATIVAEVFRILAHADASLAQIPQSHYTFLEALRLQGTRAQREFFFGLVHNGALLANAQTERGPHAVNVDTTTLSGTGEGGYVLTGRKFYSTGALFADWLVVRASLSDGSSDAPTSTTPKAIAFVPRDAPGLQIVDDWDGMGQRTTASGTVVLDDVAEYVIPFSSIFDQPTTYGAHAQLLHAAIDVGIATGSLAAGVGQAASARPHFEAQVHSAADDPTLIQVAGELAVTVRGAQALLGDAARQLDAARADLTEDSAAAASVAYERGRRAAAAAVIDTGVPVRPQPSRPRLRMFPECSARAYGTLIAGGPDRSALPYPCDKSTLDGCEGGWDSNTT